jgi:Flp pilus assembly pilin Flp
MPSPHSGEVEIMQAPALGLAGQIKQALIDFDKEEDGMNTVEVIILLFVAAVILIAFFTLIWPKIREAVIAKLEELFGTTG